MSIHKRNCNTCGKYYEGQGKFYCSIKCRNKFLINKTSYKKGHLPTNGVFKKGHKLSQESINKMHKTKQINKKIPWNTGGKMALYHLRRDHLLS